MKGDHSHRKTTSLVRGILFILSGLVCACTVQNQAPARREEAWRLVEAGARSLEAGDLMNAEASFALAVAVAPYAPAYDGLGCVYSHRGEELQAYQFFRKALDLDPKSSEVYAHLAALYLKNGLISEALQLYEHALQLDPLNYQARNNYAVLLSESGLSSKEELELHFRKAQIALPTTLVEHNLKAVEHQ